MSTKVTITVEASAEHPQVLDVRDAMQQVLDFFELLTADGSAEPLRWKLVSASTNSPFSAVAEAVSVDPAIDITPVARARLAETGAFLAAISDGKRPSKAISRRRREVAKRLLRRNTNGVGRTRAEFSNEPRTPILLTPAIAVAALEVLDQDNENEFDLLVGRKPRVEIGSIEGRLVDVGTDYNLPAIHVLERKTGRKIACRVDEAVRDSIAGSAGFADVWEHRRVVVRGRIYFDASGVISRMQATSISPVHPRSMTLHDLEDRNFSDGLDTSSYLERLREGDLG